MNVLKRNSNGALIRNAVTGALCSTCCRKRLWVEIDGIRRIGNGAIKEDGFIYYVQISSLEDIDSFYKSPYGWCYLLYGLTKATDDIAAARVWSGSYYRTIKPDGSASPPEWPHPAGIYTLYPDAWAGFIDPPYGTPPANILIGDD